MKKITPDLVDHLKSILAHNPLIMHIVAAINKQGGTALLVGGAVRDLLLNLPIKDLDIEVHRITPATLEKILSAYGPVSLVGKSFGVFRLHGLGNPDLTVDWSLPRTDSTGRKPEVTIDPHIGYEKAFERRDLTINAMGIDLVTYELIDPYHGQEDLINKILRAPNNTFFIEDPLRLYRVMQFVGRFAMNPSDDLNRICSTMTITSVSRERIEGEFEKLLLLSPQPSRGIRWLHHINRITEILPELAATIGVPQNPAWHPEGDVFEHSLQALDAAVMYDYQRHTKLVLLYAALFHDIGKPCTTQLREGRIVSPGHAQEGVPLVKNLLRRITNQDDLINGVAKLVDAHMAPVEFIKGDAKDGAYKRLARKLAPEVNLALLTDLSSADKRGRNPAGPVPLATTPPEIIAFQEKVKELNILYQPEIPILQGKDLLDLVAPGKELGALLSKAYDLQINEGIQDKQELKTIILKSIIKKSRLNDA